MNAEENKQKTIKRDLIKLAVFDFDGTIIPVQSGARLGFYMTYHRKLKLTTSFRLLWWGFRYKLRLPFNEETSRKLIFKAFEGSDADEVDSYLDEFYKVCLKPYVREDIIDRAKKLKEEGNYIVVVSATFEPVLKSFIKDGVFNDVVGTKMLKNDNNCYTGEVDGVPCANEEKIARLAEYANEKFGRGNWCVEYVFADHHTDKALLSLAVNPVAVDPDNKLERYAKNKKWEIIKYKREKRPKEKFN